MNIEYGLVGEKLGHSYSKLLHSCFGSYRYEYLELAPAEAEALFRSRAFQGLNVTIPYKKTAFNCCDEVSETARETGSVNTLLVRPDGTLYGHNTDVGGFIFMLQSARIDPAGRKCAILGSGGTSLTARTALRRMNAAEITVVSRTGSVNYENVYRLCADCEVLVNCTPVGMFPNNGHAPVDISRFPCLRGVADVIYNPERTRLIMEAKKRGLPCVSGLTMLAEQAREAAELFTGDAIPREKTRSACSFLRAQTLNLVLIGMPGCGKSTVASELGRLMGREVLDCDRLIEERVGMSIPEIFARDGEEGFRRLETEILREITALSGKIIAAGGGAVIKDENIDLMRQNGRVCFLKRPLEKLARDGRPLSSSAEAVGALWEQRKNLYEKAADFAVMNGRSTAEAAEEIRGVFQGLCE